MRNNQRLKSYHESQIRYSTLHLFYLKNILKPSLVQSWSIFFFLNLHTQNGVSTSIILSGDVRTDTILSFIFDKNDISGYKANKS